MFNEDKGANRGEWSELYAFCYILNAGRLHAADIELNRLEGIFFPVIKVIREEIEGHRIDYCTGETIKIYHGDTLLRELARDDFDAIAQTLYNKILTKNDNPTSSSGTFKIPLLEPFFDSVYVNKIKADSTKKRDITLQMHDIYTGINQECGFSIKSFIGADPTLLNSSDATNIVYEIANCTDEIMNNTNQIATRSKIIDRVKFLQDQGCVFIVPESLESTQFDTNLRYIDSSMPKFVAHALLYSYSIRGRHSNDVISYMMDQNPLNYVDVDMYPYKFKKLLSAFALGMTPTDESWKGVEDANGGYITVKRDGEIVCYYLYQREEFENYLFSKTHFDTPSTSRRDAFCVYKENDTYKIRLNLDIRFNR